MALQLVGIALQRNMYVNLYGFVYVMTTLHITLPQRCYDVMVMLSVVIILGLFFFCFFFLFTIFTLGVGQAMPVLPPLPASYTLSLFKFQLLER